MNSAAFTLSEIESGSLGQNWYEFLNVNSFSMGLYNVAAGTTDKESHSPHDRDEIYVGVGGRGHLTADGELHQVEVGTVVYVKAGVEHHFHDVTEDLSVLVFFAGSPNAGEASSKTGAS